MSDQQDQAAKTAQTEQAPAFNLQRVYLKDMSVEMPNAPQTFLEQEAPTVSVNVGVGGQRLADTVFEVTITVTVTTKIEENIVYLVEATQGGIFELSNMPAEQIDPILGIVCPTMLYPYLRSNVADAITRTSLPPLHLADINFQGLYEQRLAEQGKHPDTAASKMPEDSGIILPASMTRQ
jgi:preprotein translocase subunit SecB